MDLIVKADPKVILKQYILISLIFPLLGLIASIIQTTSDPVQFPWKGNLQGMVEMTALGLGVFITMVVVTIPIILNDKLIISNNHLIWQNWKKQKKIIEIRDITNIEQGWKAITPRGKIQVLRISTNTSTITIEIKKYQEKDIDILTDKLKEVNPRINSNYKRKNSFVDEAMNWLHASYK